MYLYYVYYVGVDDFVDLFDVCVVVCVFDYWCVVGVVSCVGYF